MVNFRCNTKWVSALLLGIALALVFVIGTSNVSEVQASTAGVTRFVATDGADGGSCGSASARCRTIQYAVNVSGSGDVILVARGTYTYNPANDQCGFLQTRSVVCFVDKALTILGGYTTGNWLNPDPLNNPTIIDGQNTYRGVAIIGYNTRTTNLRMEGFTIQNGLAQGPTYVNPYDPSGIGGGMWASLASVTLRDVVFRANRAIGANTGAGAGGGASGAGLRIESAPAPSLLERVTFDRNQSIGGAGPDRGGVAFGALFLYGSNVTVSYATLTNNQALAGNSSGYGSSGGLMADALGGGIAVETGSVVLQHIVATGNQAVGGNAGVSGGNGFGGGIFAEDAALISVSDSYVSANTARGASALNGGFGGGGGIIAFNSAALIDRVQLIANNALGGPSSGGGNAGPGGGGGLYLWAARGGIPAATVNNTIVADNLVAMGASGASIGGGGGGIQVQGLPANITHATIARNRLGSGLVAGQGLLVLAAPGVAAASVNLNYSIVAEHTIGGSGASAVLVQAGNSLVLNRGLFAGNTKDTNSDGSPMPEGVMNGLNSMLKASSAGFVSPGAPNEDYHIQLGSPARDQAAGSSMTIDIDRNARISPDIGADEWINALNNRVFLPVIRN